MSATGVSPYGIADIMAHEGVVPFPYRDSRGIWTSDVGHTAAAGPPDPAKMPRGVERPMTEVVTTFRRDLAKFEARVRKAVTVPMRQHEMDALVSFDFNTGGIAKANLTRSFNAGRRLDAADQFMGWIKPASLIGRRKKEQALFRDGTYSSGGFANVYPADANGKVLRSKGKRVNVMPVIAGIVDANARDADADADTQKGVATGASGAAAGGSTQIPDLPTDGATLRIFLIGLAVAGVVIGIAFLARAAAKRTAARSTSAAAAAALAAEIANAPDIEGDMS